MYEVSTPEIVVDPLYKGISQPGLAGGTAISAILGKDQAAFIEDDNTQGFKLNQRSRTVSRASVRSSVAMIRNY